MFKKYQHIERFGTDAVKDISFGKCYIFYKIDGTNGSVWFENDTIKAGSRNRELSLDNDNAGFLAYVINDDRIKNFLVKYPNVRLFGEWLVPHTIKTYRDDSWRKFYIFDVCIDREDGTMEYINYDYYKILLDEFNLDYIVPLCIVKNPTYEFLISCLSKTNEFLIKDGESTGEGIVIKNYEVQNKIWAKIVSAEFKENHYKTMGSPEVNMKEGIEEQIVNKFLTSFFIEKEYAKIVNEKQGWESKYIPMLLGRVYSEFIKDEMWEIIKTYKNPQINFKVLNNIVTRKIKEVKRDVFY